MSTALMRFDCAQGGGPEAGDAQSPAASGLPDVGVQRLVAVKSFVNFNFSLRFSMGSLSRPFRLPRLLAPRLSTTPVRHVACDEYA